MNWELIVFVGMMCVLAFSAIYLMLWYYQECKHNLQEAKGHHRGAQMKLQDAQRYERAAKRYASYGDARLAEVQKITEFMIKNLEEID